MSAIGQIVRILVLAAICSGVTLADGHPRQDFSDVERRTGSSLGAQPVPEIGSENAALPQVESFVSRLPSSNKSVSLAAESFEGQAPSLQIAPATRLAKLGLPQVTPLPSNPTVHDDIALPNVEPFDLPAVSAWPGVVPAKWADLQSRFLSDEGSLAACSSGDSKCSQAADRFLAIVELGRKRQGRARLGWINRAVNLRIKPMSDSVQYGHVDFWASPLQTLRTGAGDCEDYAILKYAALRELGMAPSDLRLVIVQDNMRQTQHAVLAVREENDWLILDNRTMVVLAAEQARHYYPLFVMDYRGVRTFSAVAELR